MKQKLNNNLLRSTKAKVVLLFLGYFGGAFLGQFLNTNNYTATIWPPSGILLAFLIISKKRTWIYFVAAAYLANILFDVINGRFLVLSLLYSTGNIFESVAGAYIIKKFYSDNYDLTNLKQLFLLIIVSLFSTAISASIGVFSSKILYNININWFVWWSGDIAGIMIFAPLVITNSSLYLKLTNHNKQQRKLELFVLIATIAVVSVFIFMHRIEEYPSLEFLIFPPLLWSAIRFGKKVTTFNNAIIACVALWGTANGFGPFANEAVDASIKIFAFQILIGGSLFVILAISIIVYEQRKTFDLLFQSEEKFRNLVNSTEDVVFTLDTHQRLTSIYGRLLDKFNLSSENLISKRIDEIFSGDAAAMHKKSNLKALHGENVVFEFNVDGRDNKYYFQTSLSPLYNSVGTIQGVVGIGRDITESKLSEEKAAANNKRIESLLKITQKNFNSVPEILDFALSEAVKLTKSKFGYFYSYDEEKEEFTLNSRSKEALMQSADLKKPMVWALKDAGIWGEVVRQRKEIVVNDFQAQNPLKKGYPKEHIKLYKYLSIPIFEGGKIVAVVGVANKNTNYDKTDILQLKLLMDYVWKIAQRKQAEKTLRESKERYQTLFDNATDGILIFDFDGSIVDVNYAYAKMHGYSIEEIKKMNLRDIDPDPNRKVEGRIERVVDGEVLHFEVEHYHKDGHLFPMDVIANLIELDNRKYIIGFHRDITERKHAEKVLIENERLSAISETTSGVAHDFNNSLQSIYSNVELSLLSKNLPDAVRRRLQTTKTLAEDAAQRVQLLQRFGGKVRAGSQKELIDINNIVEEVILQTRPLWKDNAEKEGLVISVETDLSEVPKVKGNIAELRSVFYNLIKNSVEAMPDGGEILIETGMLDNYVFVRITDTGKGMDEDTKTRIFQPFFTTKGFETGRGIGLSGVYSIINEHNGKVYVKNSSPNQGTVMKIMLPLAEEEQQNKGINKEQTYEGIIKILWVDDDPLICEVAEEMLEELGHEGDVVESGLKALEYVDRKDYDLIVTDIGMSGMNGWQLADLINEKKSNSVKIAVLSGWGAEISEEKMKEHGVSYILSKPFRLNQLEELLAKVMNE